MGNTWSDLSSQVGLLPVSAKQFLYQGNIHCWRSPEHLAPTADTSPVFEQDGPSLESSSYLSLSLRYLGSLGPWDLGTPGPWNPWTLGLLDLFPPPTPPHSSPYILKTPPISASYSPPLVWFGYGGGVSCDIGG